MKLIALFNDIVFVYYTYIFSLIISKDRILYNFIQINLATLEIMGIVRRLDHAFSLILIYFPKINHSYLGKQI